MKKSRLAAQSRSHLDARIAKLPRVAHFTPPAKGWIRAIRSALGMTTAQMAKRMGVKQPSVIDYERSEAQGGIELATLRRAAEALNCTLVYALVPNKPLEKIVREKARVFLRRRLEPVEHSMLLENQKVRARKAEANLDEIVRETNPRLFWD
jgi:predicted DNA-binding mobile mystery protein A